MTVILAIVHILSSIHARLGSSRSNTIRLFINFEVHACSAEVLEPVQSLKFSLIYVRLTEYCYNLLCLESF